MEKPIRVFYSSITDRFFAAKAYKEIGDGMFLITGKKFDVTQDIASIIVKHKITFTPKKKKTRRARK